MKKTFAVAAVSTLLALPTAASFAASTSDTATPSSDYQSDQGQTKMGSKATDTANTMDNSQTSTDVTNTGRQGHSAQMENAMPDGNDDQHNAGAGMNNHKSDVKHGVNNADTTPTGRQGHSSQMESTVPDGDSDPTQAGGGVDEGQDQQ
ncbi:hypothetical protein BH688_10795 [Kushneria phosphatilytica]|nr:hypothetical protein BH688_10795 [Kushneria phosphatilytica]